MPKEKTIWKVNKGCLVPADNLQAEKLRQKKYAIGQILIGTLNKCRNPKFHRFVHQFGAIVAENIEAFRGLGAHDVLKRIQIEGNIACDEVALNFPGLGPCTYRVPRSISFVDMDEEEFQDVYMQFCDYITRTYWPTDEGKQFNLNEIMG